MRTNRRSYFLFASLLLAFAGSVVSSIASAQQPNVVFILSDDQTWTDFGFMDHPHIQTPNLDQLAKAGMLYERGYVTAPLCRPSLASLVTGMYPHQTGIRGNDPLLPNGMHYRDKEAAQVSRKMRAAMTAPMAEHPSFVKQLKDAGYATLETGKWWEGNPLDHGFTDAMTHGDTRRGGRHGKVALRKSDGSTVIVPLKKLSAQDREFIQTATEPNSRLSFEEKE